MADNEQLTALAAPFPPEVVEWKAQATRDNRALAVAYIDARAVMDRLDEVVGPANWQDEYEVLPDGNVICALSVRVGGEWIHKEDVGGESDQHDAGDKRKSAFSDALKRAAVKWGVGRYLYSLPAQWVDYDPQKKQLRGKPLLPDWAIPAKEVTPPRPPTVGRLAPEDVQRLCGLLVQKGVSVSSICDFYKIAVIDELSDDQYAEAVKRLNEKPDKRKPQAAQAS